MILHVTVVHATVVMYVCACDTESTYDCNTVLTSIRGILYNMASKCWTKLCSNYRKGVLLADARNHIFRLCQNIMPPPPPNFLRHSNHIFEKICLTNFSSFPYSKLGAKEACSREEKCTASIIIIGSF